MLPEYFILRIFFEFSKCILLRVLGVLPVLKAGILRVLGVWAVLMVEILRLLGVRAVQKTTEYKEVPAVQTSEILQALKSTSSYEPRPTAVDPPTTFRYVLEFKYSRVSNLKILGRTWSTYKQHQTSKYLEAPGESAVVTPKRCEYRYTMYIGVPSIVRFE